jgi:PKD repeat protein
VQNKVEAMYLKNTCLKVCTAIACVAMLLVLTMPMPIVSAVSNAQILIYPAMSKMEVGETVTLTVNVTNVAQLVTWEADLKYNGTVVNCTAAWVPSDNVFAGHAFAPVGPLFGRDVVDNMSYLQFGAFILSSTDYASVTNGILYEANFTLLAKGTTTVTIADGTDSSRTIHIGTHSWDTFYSALYDPSQNIIPFTSSQGSTVRYGALNVPPVAAFSIIVPTVNNASKLILKGNVPLGVNYVNMYVGYSANFSASASYDPDGYVTRYVWDFGDGTATHPDMVNTTDPVVSHAYNATGEYNVKLIVYDNGTPPLPSPPVTSVVLVGVMLQLYNWSPLLYSVIVLICAAVVLYAARQIQRAVRRRAERRRRLLTTRPPTTLVPEAPKR